VVEEPSTSIVTVPLTDNDRLALEEMARMTGLSLVNVVRVALWEYGRALDTEIPPGVFGVRRAAPVHADGVLAARH
jgi:hypothetical protein